MNPARWQQIKSAFGEVLQLEPAQRSAYIEAIGATDPDLRERVASLLFEHEKDSGEFLRNPAVGLEIYHDLVDIDADTWLGKHIGPYRLVQELGSGGMGEVYLAERVEADFDQRVAIKLIRSGEASTAVVSRFKSERQILAALDHPNIAKLLDGGRTPQGQPYFVMEYVPGMPIAEYCEDKQLDIPNRLTLLIQVCDGVQYAHQNAIIHRDLKPSNILVVEVDGKPVPRIIDFGLAKTTAATQADQTQLTQFGVFMGTPGYMSPEQADVRVRNVDTRTDVYSLGAILYALLTGLQPFETAERRLPPFDEWLRRLREETPPRPSAKLRAIAQARGDEFRRLDRVPSDLDWITMKALERDRDRRYGTPAELGADLRRYLSDEPVMARPASAGYQIRRFVRRHRVVTTFIAAVAILSVVASATAVIAVKQKREAEHQAAETLRAQARLLTQAAAQRLKDNDIAGAQSIILEVLTNPESFRNPSPAAINVFQEVRAADAQLAVLSGHVDWVEHAAYSPDGTRIVTASFDKTVRIWDARLAACRTELS